MYFRFALNSWFSCLQFLSAWIGTSHHVWLEVSCNFIHCINNLALSKKKFILANLIGMSLLSATDHKNDQHDRENMVDSVIGIQPKDWVQSYGYSINHDNVMKTYWEKKYGPCNSCENPWLLILHVYYTHGYWKHNTLDVTGKKVYQKFHVGNTPELCSTCSFPWLILIYPFPIINH